MGLTVSNIVPGFDPTTIVNQLMAAAQQPVIALQQQVATDQTDSQVVNSIQSDVSALEQAASQLTLQSTVGAMQATLNTPAGQPAILTATAGSTAVNGSYNITVKQLATPTLVTSSSPDGGTTAAAISQPVSPTALLSAAGFATPITNGTFTINGVAISIDANTKLSDPNDAANSLIARINASGAGVTASIVNDAYGRPNEIQLVSNAGQAIQLGSSSDTSNFLQAAGLTTGAIIGNTATSVTGNSLASGAIAATIAINGQNVAINQTDGTFTGAQNAAYIANAINAANLGVTASVSGTNADQLVLTNNVAGSQGTINVQVSGANASAVGLTNGVYQNGTDALYGATLLGEVNPTTALGSDAFATPLNPVSGGGSFIINGVTINWTSTDTLNDVLQRINNSSANVRAVYDPFSDRVTLSSTGTGASAISMQDSSGNLLQSLHLLSNATTSVPQQLGQNAILNIAGVNNGNDILSPTNSISGYIPGVTLNLQQTSPTAQTLTIGANTTTTTNAVQTFVNALNTLINDITKDTKVDGTAADAGPLAGDTDMEGILSDLSSLLNTQVTSGAAGYQDLTTIGINTGAIGSAVGTTTNYQFNTSQLIAALQSNPNAVQQLLIGTTQNPGIMVQVNNYLNGLLAPNGLFADRQQEYTSSEQDLNSQITEQQQLLAQQQQMLQSQYAQLQTTLATLAAQNSQVMAQISALGSTGVSSSSSTSSTSSSSPTIG